MIHLALFEPEIPPNTGNIIRLCANTGSTLHLIEPLGFELDDKQLRRAGLDYREFADVKTYESYDAMLQALKTNNIYLFTTKGSRPHSDVARFSLPTLKSDWIQTGDVTTLLNQLKYLGLGLWSLIFTKYQGLEFTEL